MGHVPEDNPQIVEFRKKILLQPKFRKLRGKMNGNEIGILRDLVGKAKTPSEFQRLLDEKFSDLQAIGTILAQQTRDGKIAASNEMVRALTTPGYFIPGEVPEDSVLVPATLIMLYPKRTRMVLGAMFGKTNPWEFARKNLHLFPSMERMLQSQEGDRTDNGKFLGSVIDLIAHSYLCDVVSQFPELYKISGIRGLDISDRHNYHSHIDDSVSIAKVVTQWLPEPFGPSGEQGAGFINHFAFLAVGMEQGEILSLLGRKKARTVATWQFRLPIKLSDEKIDWNSCQLKVGFIPESKHLAFLKRCPMSASKSVSNGLGSSCWPTIENYVQFDESHGYRLGIDDPDTFLLSASEISSEI